MNAFEPVDLVIVDYNDLLSSPLVPTDETSGGTNNESLLLEKIEKALGVDGHGIIGIRNVPGFVQAKNGLLPLAYDLAHLPSHELKQLEDPKSFYNAGWSHGKEKLKSDLPDTAKASFYFNPIVDIPGTLEDRERYPASYPTNKWPSSESGLSHLEPAAKKLGRIMKEVAVRIAIHVDAYAQLTNPNYHSSSSSSTGTTLYETLKDSEKVKGRLLYYFPLSDANTDATSTSSAEDSWIGWHNDSGFLTALAGDIYMDPESGTILNTGELKDASTVGLHIVSREHGSNDDVTSAVRKVSIPHDCMAIQIGECTQIITGGSVVATPHCVRGAPNVARASLACFIDTPPSFPLSVPRGRRQQQQQQQGEAKIGNDDDDDIIDAATMAAVVATPDKVPPLAARWTDGMTFGDFLQKTFEMYYQWGK